MLQQLFSTEERIRILRIVLFEEGLTNSQITSSANVNKGLVSIFLRSLVEQGIVERRERNYHFLSTPFVKQLKILLNLDTLAMIEDQVPEEVMGLGLFGSWATGNNRSDSDIDIWLFMDKIDNNKIGEVLGLISNITDQEVNILPLDQEKWDRLKKEDVPFTKSLLNDSITLSGVGIEQMMV